MQRRLLACGSIVSAVAVVVVGAAAFAPEQQHRRNSCMNNNIALERSRRRRRRHPFWEIGGSIGPSNNEEQRRGDDDDKPRATTSTKPKSYKFGDLTKSLFQRGVAKVNEMTGHDEYKFGDLSRHLDAKAKERVLQTRTTTDQPHHLVNDDDHGSSSSYQYQFGDLSRWASHLVREQAAHFAGKDEAADYRLGDVTKTIVQKVQTGQYKVDDVYLALRVLATAGIALSPITNALPLKLLLQLLEADLAKDVTIRVSESVALALDARCKQALTGRADYQLGDIARDRLQRRVTQITGKDQYEFGDIVRSLIMTGGNVKEEIKEEDRRLKSAQPLSKLLLQDESGAEQQDLLDWDERFLKAAAAVSSAKSSPTRPSKE